jgi:cytoskeletal protein CcmA (bactofilin family)
MTSSTASAQVGSFLPPSALEKSNKSGKRVLTVGNDILLKGEIATCDRLVIEGKVDATLNDVHTVEISEGGSFKGSAQIEDAEISGLFEGDLIVRNRLVIYATGKVRGKITYGEIEIERGGELTGEIKTTSPASAISTRPRQSATAPKDDKVAA